MAPPRIRPPNLSLAASPVRANTIIEQSPIDINIHPDPDDLLDVDRDDDDDDNLFSSPSSSNSSGSPSLTDSSDLPADDISKDLAVLENIRKSVHKNLRLRPIRSTSALPKVNLQKSLYIPPKDPSWRDSEPQSAESTDSSNYSPSTYYTPLSETPLSAHFIGSTHPRSHPSPRTPVLRPPRPIDSLSLFNRLSSANRPLLIDTRPPPSHLAYHIQHSINIAIPSLILKRCRKTGGGFQSLEALRQFITTEDGKDAWDELIGPGGPWTGDVVVYDEEMDLKDQTNSQVPAWALIPVISPLLSYGSVDYLDGGISAAKLHPRLRTLILSGGEFDFGGDGRDTMILSPSLNANGKKGAGGLFQLDTQAAFRSKQYPDIDCSTTSTIPPLPRSPMPLMPSAMHSSVVNIVDASPSPPPSQLAFRRPPPPRRPSAPNLRKLDTKSAERLNPNLPKLHVRTKPFRSATLSVPPSSLSLNLAPHSPSHLNLVYSNHSPPASARWSSSPSNTQNEFLTAHPPHSSYFTPPHTPNTPMPIPPSPATARPDDMDQPPTTEDAFPGFIVSTILPNFLYLGPEMTSPEHVEELRDLGVKRILNLAAECDDDHGLGLREVFERYVRIPMRDAVDEENIRRSVREVCEILDDARLHSAPTYVHCRAGKSRSVTAVIAYLIHANHWTLSRAYAFVLERRKGISPNIGFVSELMTFEEEELGGKSVGVQPKDSTKEDEDCTSTGGGQHHVSAGPASRRPGHIRESLPPVLYDGQGGGSAIGGSPGPMSAGAMMGARVGDAGQEMEIKDSSGRYRHVRRAPVDETTLQPMRRVSKAGLESSIYG